MAFTKITNVDTANKGVVGLPDTPGLSTHDMQAKFDELATDVIIPKHNSLIDELEATTAAESIGAVSTNHASGANVQALFDALDAYVESSAGATKEYVDQQDGILDARITSVYNTLDGRITTVDSTLTTSIQNVYNTLTGRLNVQDTRITAATNTANTANDTANTANSTANTANQTANSANQSALTALQEVDSIIALLQILLGHIYLNTESEDRIITESGDRLTIDY